MSRCYGDAGGLQRYGTAHQTFRENLLDTADVTKRWRSTEAVLQRAVSELNQVANGRQLPSSFGLRARDRAARLRSSDAPKPKGLGIPDAKHRDVVAIQLELF